MKSCYSERLEEPQSLAVLDTCDYYGEGRIITRINVPQAHRGKGIGSKLLSQCIKDADDAGVDLFLEIQASDGLDYDQLVAWYKRYGFKDIGGIFRRKACKTVKRPSPTSNG